MKLAHALLAGGGVAGLAAAAVSYFARRTQENTRATVAGPSVETKAKIDAAKTPEEVQAAVAEAAPPAPPAAVASVKAAVEAGDTAAAKTAAKDTDWYKGTIALRLTTYWPWSARGDKEKKLEGGVNDRKGHPLHSLEDFFDGKSDHVSLSGDDSAWPYGQKITFPWSDGRTVVGRVTDTGGHFRGVGKVYQATGKEPIDVPVRVKSTHAPEFVTATIVRGDTLDKAGKEVATSRFRGQNVVVGLIGLDVFGAA